MAAVDTYPPPAKRLKLMNGTPSPIMPHATESASFEEDDDDFTKALSMLQSGEATDFLNGDLDVGEKAADAVDYEDISDDDLADDEDDAGPVRPSEGMSAGKEDGLLGDTNGMPTGDQDLPTLEGDNDDLFDDVDDLFGDSLSSPVGQLDMDSSKPLPSQANGVGTSFDFDNDTTLLNSSSTLEDPSSLPLQDQALVPFGQGVLQAIVEDNNDDMDPEVREQQALFAMAREGKIPPPIENHEELLAKLYPGFEKGKTMLWYKILPQTPAFYTGRPIPKPPKAIRPTKVNLDLAQDDEKSFKSGAASIKRRREDERQRVVLVTETTQNKQTQDGQEDEEVDGYMEPIGGVTWQDLQIICADWDIKSPTLSPADKRTGKKPMVNRENDDFLGDDFWEAELGGRPSKRQKAGDGEAGFVPLHEIKLPTSFDDPELATAKLAQSVILDLNDPELLIDVRDSDPAKATKKLGSLHRSEIDSTFSKRLDQRFNISNDEAYDLLKENHQNKIRSNLSNLAVEHSMPAIKLQWPYYRTKMAKSETRSFHRPLMSCKPGPLITFDVLPKIKRKYQKNKAPKDLFPTTKDLSLADNSDALLLEYSEEHPVMLSNFGMNTRLINYYRKKGAEDAFRPKLDAGEASVLLPQDKSPLSIFGHIDPGETVQAINNSMYRAPVFPQNPKSTDFLIVRNTTGVGGNKWYLRNIDNIYTVGQQFPSVDVPGPHSRKVTTAAKNRLKMISFRRIKRNNPHKIQIEEVTEHFPDTTDMQNRQKMKEFMVFNKDFRAWEMRPGEPIPDEDVLRTYIKPEDVCLLEAMQTGQQHLIDAGYAKEEGDVGDEEENDGDSLEQQLAPWYTTRNFLNATQGKAMLQLHGEGDPSGRGEAFSFIKTSMKGGFKAIGESIEDRLDANRQKELNGHSYNVARQQKSYEESIRRIWSAQKESLSSTIEHSDTEMDIDDAEIYGQGTPRSEAHTPAAFRGRDDDMVSQFSRFSTGSASNKVLRITRRVKDKKGRVEEVTQTVTDPRVIRAYIKRRQAVETENSKSVFFSSTIMEIWPTDNL
jgi:transcription initiation factor TFIID subunit 1, fungi type